LGLDPGDLPSETLKSGSLERGQSVAYFLDVAGAMEQSYFLDFEKVRPQTIFQREILERIIFFHNPEKPWTASRPEACQ